MQPVQMTNYNETVQIKMYETKEKREREINRRNVFFYNDKE